MPAKSFGEIYLETTEKPEAVPGPDSKSVITIADQVATEDPAGLIKKVDDLLVAARLNYVNGEWCNLLQDIRDVLSSGAAKTDIAEYIHWRMDHADWFKIPKPDAYGRPPETTPVESDKATELEKKAIEAPEKLRPYWLYLRGALTYRSGDREECQKWFDRVHTEYPESPRAEFALFMSARCAFAQSLTDWTDESFLFRLKGEELVKAKKEFDEKVADQWKKTKSLFDAYLEKYPEGRLTADTYGWIGGMFSRQGKSYEALNNFIKQVKAPGHPEIKKSALFMCADLLSKNPNDNVLSLIAENPVIAMGATYQILNSAEAPEETSDFSRLNTEGTSALAKKWRQSILPKLASSVASRQELYKPGDWPPRYLAMLTQAASAAGNQKEALKLSDVPISELEGSDDLLLARAIAFQRAGKPAGAITTYRMLLENFPTSQLADGARLKLALALADDHKAGEAVIELRKLVKNAEAGDDYIFSDTVYPPGFDQLKMSDSFVSRNISGAEIGQISQILDSLYNFAPPEELATCMQAQGVEETLKFEMRNILIQRHLAMEEFTEAKKLMTDAEFQLIAAKLERLTKAAKDTKDAYKKAKLMNELGDSWAAARGNLLRFPLDCYACTSIFGEGLREAGLRRRENGKALGYEDVDVNLEERDELRHASRWWSRAARSDPSSNLAANALWKTLKAMPQIANGSDFSFLRAVETNAAKTSRQLYDQLLTKHPKSIEARKYAAYWNFLTPPINESTGEMQFGNHTESSELCEIGRMGYTTPAYEAFDNIQSSISNNPYDGYWRKIDALLLAFKEHAADWDTVQLAHELNDISEQIVATNNPTRAISRINVIDDLALFLKEPNLTPEARKNYIELRLAFGGLLIPTDGYDQEALKNVPNVPELMESNSLKPFLDYVDFLRVVKAGREVIIISTDQMEKGTEQATLSTRDYWSQESAARKFLEKYPKSAKREAAMLLRARALHWLMTPYLTTFEVDQDNTSTYVYCRDKFEPKRLLASMDAYDREFPNGRYSPEIRDWRANLAWRMHDWSKAINLTIENLDDKSHPDLQPEAAVRLANIFADLANEKYRSDIVDVLRKNPRAIELLRKYLEVAKINVDHPLRYLGVYLGNKLGFTYPEPPRNTAPVDQI